MKILNVTIPDSPALVKAMAMLDKLPAPIKTLLKIPPTPVTPVVP